MRFRVVNVEPSLSGTTWGSRSARIPVGNSHITSTNGKMPEFTAWVSNLYSAVLNVSSSDWPAYISLPNVSTWAAGLAINGTMFRALQINPHVRRFQYYIKLVRTKELVKCISWQKQTC